MSVLRAETILYWIVKIGVVVLPFTLLLVVHTLFFPFVSGKAFVFRIIVELMVAAWTGLLIIDFRKYWPKWNSISSALSAFVAIIFITSLLGSDFNNSFWSNFERMEGIITYLHLIFLFFVLAGTFHTKREWSTLFGFSIFASVLLAFYGILEATGEIASFASNSQIIATLGNPLYVAAYLSFNIFLSAFLWLQTRSAMVRWLLGGVIILELGTFFMTGARGAFLGMLVGIGAVLVLQTLTNGNLKKKVLLGSAIVVIAATPFILHALKDQPLIQQSGYLSRFANITISAGEARLNIWGMAIDAFKERPILGWGTGNFIIPFTKHYDPKIFFQEPWFDHTHNTVLEWLVAGGIIGLLAYLSIFASIIPALVRSVREGTIEQGAAFIFIGMFASYLLQMLFVFDTQATYTMLILLLGFFYAASSYSKQDWEQKNTLMLTSSGAVRTEEAPGAPAWQSRKTRRASAQRIKGVVYPPLSFFRAGVIIFVFGICATTIFFVNIKPFQASTQLIQALNLFRQQRLDEANEAFKKALELSQGTIGTEETREHLVFSLYGVFQNAELIRTSEGQALYRTAAEEMEKQVAQNSQTDLKIKQNILLAQLYHQWALFSGNREALTKAFEYYEKAIEFAPKYVSTYPVVANLYAQTGDLERAVQLSEKAVDLLTQVNMYDPRIFYSKALFYTAAGRYEDALNSLRIIITNSPEKKLSDEMMENVISATRLQGTVAIPFLEEVFALDSSLSNVLLMLAQLSAGAGNIEAARLYANEAIKGNPAIVDEVKQFLEALEGQ